MKHVATIGSAVFALVAASAFAQNPPSNTPAAGKGGHIEYSSLDVNKDGKVTMAEVQGNAELRGEFGKLDTNRDDSLSVSEFAQWKQTGKSEMAPGTSTAPGQNTQRPQSDSSSGADASSSSTPSTDSSNAPKRDSL